MDKSITRFESVLIGLINLVELETFDDQWSAVEDQFDLVVDRLVGLDQPLKVLIAAHRPL